MTVMNTDYRIRQAILQVEDLYGDVISVNAKKKPLLKFGNNPNISTTEEMVWETGGIKTLPTGNDVDEIVSDDAGDSQDCIVEGHTLSGSDLTFVSQTATLNGTTPVTLSTPLYRATRLYNNDSTDFAGTVSVGDGTDDFLTTTGDNNQSLKCATSMSSGDYWLITSATFSVKRSNARSVDFKSQFKDFGKVWRTAFPLSVNTNSGSIQVDFDPVIIMKPNADMRVVATSSGTTTDVSATVNGFLASVQ